MLEWIEFKNFKALRDTRLPLGRFTLIVGANGSGKSTALLGLSLLKDGLGVTPAYHRTVGRAENDPVSIQGCWNGKGTGCLIQKGWNSSEGSNNHLRTDGALDYEEENPIRTFVAGARIFSFEPDAIARPVHLQPHMELERNGANLAGVLDHLRDQNPERFEALNVELGRWIPEFDRILFQTPGQGQRAIALRTREGKHTIKAADLSQGTLIALALLTIAYLPEPPSIICLEDPDHGLHPRLLREVRDALYRLAFPEDSGEKREPVQVIATTHNPYFLDLFREHPEQIVIAEKVGLEGKFTRLSDRKDLEEILGDAPLSEVWYSGVLGGVPAGT